VISDEVVVMRDTDKLSVLAKFKVS